MNKIIVSVVCILIVVAGSIFLIQDKEAPKKVKLNGGLEMDYKNFETIVNDLDYQTLKICNFEGECGIINKIKIEENK